MNIPVFNFHIFNPDVRGKYYQSWIFKSLTVATAIADANATPIAINKTWFTRRRRLTSGSLRNMSHPNKIK